MYRPRKPKERKNSISIKWFSASLITVSLLSIALTYSLTYYYINNTIINDKNEYISKLENVIENNTQYISELEYKCSQIGINEYEEIIYNLNTSLQKTDASLKEMTQNFLEVNNINVELTKKLDLYMIIVNGTANTRNPTTFPVSITFDNGVKHKVPVVNRKYSIMLQNHQTYEVSIQWKFLIEQEPIIGSTIAGTFHLDWNQKIKQEHWEIS